MQNPNSGSDHGVGPWLLECERSHREIRPAILSLTQTLLVILSACWTVGVASGWEPKNREVAKGESSLELKSKALTESSGLAFSYRDKECLWSHNDSGDKARLIAFSSNGKACGRADLIGVKADDWEDMASFDDGGPRLIVADVGDNSSKRKSVSLYLFNEPDPREKTKIQSYQHLVVRYPNGPQNCESVAVDVENRRILLLQKSPVMAATVHEIPLPLPPNGREADTAVTKIEVEAAIIQRLAIPLATGMDLCPITGDLWITSYFHSFRYPANRRLTLETRLNLLPQMVELPKLKQVEAIAIDDLGRIWVTSEGVPARMQRVLANQQMLINK